MNAASNEKLAQQIYEDFLDSCDDELEAKDLEGNFLPNFLHLAFDYADVVFPEFSPSNVESVLFHWMPRKFTVDAHLAGDIIAEIKVFFEYAKEKYQLQQSDRILNLLNREGIAKELQAALADRRLYGLAKSMLMPAMDLGYDVTDPEQLNEFFELHNQQLMQSRTSANVPATDSTSFARLDEGHSSQPSAPKSPPRSPAEQRKFNKERHKALAKKKRK